MTFLTDIATAQTKAMQHFGLLQIGEVDGEPISLEEARAQCNLDVFGSPPESEHDFWLENIGVPASRQYCENYKGVAYAPRTMELVSNAFPAAEMDLPFGPVQSVTSVKYLDDVIAQAAYDAAYTAAYDIEFASSADVDLATAAGVAAGDIAFAAALEQTIDPADYVLDVYSTPARLLPAYGVSWPSARNATNSVRVRYVTGYNLPDDSPIAYSLPPLARIGMLLMLGHLFENREGVSAGTVMEIPLGVKANLDLAPGGYRLDFA